MHCEVLSTGKQHRGSVGVGGDGDVDDEDALVSNAALQWDGGGLHLEAHKSRSVQSPQGEDDPPAHLVSDAKHPAHHACLAWFLLKYGKRRTLLQDAGLWERRQSYHIVIGWNARGEREQLVLQEQRGSSCGTVLKAGPVAGPWRIDRKLEGVTDTYNYLHAYVQYAVNTAHYYLPWASSTLIGCRAGRVQALVTPSGIKTHLIVFALDTLFYTFINV